MWGYTPQGKTAIMGGKKLEIVSEASQAKFYMGYLDKGLAYQLIEPKKSSHAAIQQLSMHSKFDQSRDGTIRKMI